MFEWCSTGDATKARCLYGQIPEEHWSYPKWVSPLAAAEARVRMRENGVLYGGRESYHHMCRYFSGFIHKHPLLKEFDFYWRMEPDVHYYCSLDYDPFLFMQVSCYWSSSPNFFQISIKFLVPSEFLVSSASSPIKLFLGVLLLCKCHSVLPGWHHVASEGPGTSYSCWLLATVVLASHQVWCGFWGFLCHNLRYCLAFA